MHEELLYNLLCENNYLLRENNRLLNELKDSLVGAKADAREFGLNVAADIFANSLHFGLPQNVSDAGDRF